MVFFLLSMVMPGFLCAAETAQADDIDALKTDIDELNKKVDEVETRTLVDKVNVGAELRTRFDWYTYKNSDQDIDEKVNGIPTTRFRLNLRSDVTENLKFTGRLTMYKMWGDKSFHSNYDETYWERTPTDTDIRVERAYVDYFFTIGPVPMALTFGRLPFTDGLPTDLREDTPRKSTYPSLSWDAESDGIGLTVGMERLTTLPGANFKVLYTKWITDNDDEVYRHKTLLNPLTGDTLYTYSTSMPVYAAHFETGLPGRLDGSIVMLNYLVAPKITLRDDDIDRELSENLTVTDIDSPKSLGSLRYATAFMESRNVLGSWLDCFAGYSLLKSTSEGLATITYATAIPNPAYPPATGVPMIYYQGSASRGLLCDDGAEDQSAYAYHVGFRLNLPFMPLNNPKIGVEFNHGSKYWYGLTGASEDPLHKLNERGDVWDFYYIQPIDRHFMARLGYTMINRDYAVSPFGEPVKDDVDITDLYFLLDVRF